LNNADANVIAKVATEMLNGISYEEAEKKVRTDTELFSILALGQELNKSMEEVLLMTQDEFHYWIAYFKVKAEREKLHYGRSTVKNKDLM
jgi:hypothetical protein